jgi:hypothetical protein
VFSKNAARDRICGRPRDGPPVVSSFDVSTQGDVRFALHVTNNAGKRMELTFPSGLTHDIVVLDDLGREVWRWSEGRMFTQTLQNRILDASETVSYAAEWQPETALLLPSPRCAARTTLSSSACDSSCPES